MSRPSSFLFFFSQLNQSFQLKRPHMKVPYSKAVLQMLFCLKRNQLIYGFSLHRGLKPSEQKTIIVFLVYCFNTPLISQVFIYSSQNRVISISNSALIKFQLTIKTYSHPILLLSTSQGFLTNYEALAKNIGGHLVGFLR